MNVIKEMNGIDIIIMDPIMVKTVGWPAYNTLPDTIV